MKFIPFLLDVNTTIVPGTATTNSVASTTTDVAMSSGGNPTTLILAYFVILGLIMYFCSIKPAKKREQEAETMRNSVKIGDSVLLKTGMFGKVVDVTYENFIVELGLTKTVNIPVLKSEIYAVREVNLSNEAPVVEVPEKSKDKNKNKK